MKCHHHPTCPGCPILDKPYAEQLTVKEARLRRSTDLFPHLPEPRAIVRSKWTEGYRHRLKLPVQIGRDVRVGLYAKGPSRRILHTPDCPVLAPALREALPGILHWMRGKRSIHSLDLRVSHATGELQVIFAAVGGDLPGGKRGARALLRDLPQVTSIAVSKADPQRKRVMGSRPTVLAGKQTLEEAIGDVRYDLLPGSFFQVDPRQAEVLQGLVREGVGKAQTVLDLYSGVGAYALMLAPGRRRVVAVEEVRQAAESARRRAPKNVEIVTSKVENMKLQERFDVAILNPARRGSDPDSLARIAKMARKLVYVSCGPETLARDLDVLAAHGMRTTSLQPIDLFPQTPEVETIAIVERGDARTSWPLDGGSAQGPVESGISGARGRPSLVWMLLVGRVSARRMKTGHMRVIGEVATHTLVEIQVRAPMDNVVRELAQMGLHPAGKDRRTAHFFAEKAGLQRPFIHVVKAGNATAPLHGDLVLTLRRLRAPKRWIDDLQAGRSPEARQSASPSRGRGGRPTGVRGKGRRTRGSRTGKNRGNR